MSEASRSTSSANVPRPEAARCSSRRALAHEAVGGADQLMHDAGLGHGMASIGDDAQLFKAGQGPQRRVSFEARARGSTHRAERRTGRSLARTVHAPLNGRRLLGRVHDERAPPRARRGLQMRRGRDDVAATHKSARPVRASLLVDEEAVRLHDERQRAGGADGPPQPRRRRATANHVVETRRQPWRSCRDRARASPRCSELGGDSAASNAPPFARSTSSARQTDVLDPARRDAVARYSAIARLAG